MKKLLLGLILILPLAVIAEEDLIAPQWESFAPPAFVNVKEPKGLLGKINVDAAYWYNRRVDFEKALSACDEKKTYEEKYSCYEDLKSSQYRANNDFNAKMEARENAINGIPEMRDRTDMMIPLNGYLDQFTRYQPNELRGY